MDNFILVCVKSVWILFTLVILFVPVLFIYHFLLSKTSVYSALHNYHKLIAKYGMKRRVYKDVKEAMNKIYERIQKENNDG